MHYCNPIPLSIFRYSSRYPGIPSDIPTSLPISRYPSQYSDIFPDLSSSLPPDTPLSRCLSRYVDILPDIPIPLLIFLPIFRYPCRHPPPLYFLRPKCRRHIKTTGRDWCSIGASLRLVRQKLRQVAARALRTSDRHVFRLLRSHLWGQGAIVDDIFGFL